MPLYPLNIDGVKIPVLMDDQGRLILSPYSAITLDGGADVRIYGYNEATWEAALLDRITRSMTSIDHAHHEIHEGDHFMYTDAVELGNGVVQNYLITTPNTTRWAHMIFILEGSAITQFELYEGADRVGSVLQTVGNSNRNSATAATTTIHKGYAGGSTDGTRIHLYKGGSATGVAKSGAAGTRNDEEIILKQNTKYILRVTSGTAANLTNVNLSWYEHVSK